MDVPVPGIQQAKIDFLKADVEDLLIDDKICVVLFNELALQTPVADDATNKIHYYENLGNGRHSENIADHALTFMIQGVCTKMHHTIAYYFIKKPLQTKKFVEIIKEVIRAVTNVGYEVIATVCDHAPTNVKALDVLANCKNSMDTNYFMLDNRKINIIYDVPHLYLSIRDDFREDGEIKMGNRTAKWAHLVELEAENLELQEVTKLHLNPTGKSLKDPDLAVQLLSRSVAGFLHFYSKGRTDEVKTDFDNTVKVIAELDLLYNCTNRPINRDDVIKGICQKVRKNTFHHKRWLEFIDQLKTLQYPKLEGEAKIRSQRCINGFITNLLSFQDIWKHLEDNDIDSLTLRHFNLDVLQNRFKFIIRKCSNKKKPTCQEFSLGIKAVEEAKIKKAKERAWFLF